MTLSYNKFIVLTILLSASVIGSLRWHTGTDWPAYETIYNNVENIGIFNEYFEPIFVILLKMLKSINEHYITYIVFLSLMTILIKAVAIVKLQYPITALLIYFSTFQLDMYPVRYNLALSFLFLALTLSAENKKIKYLFLLIGSGIHKVILVPMFAMIILQRNNISKITAVVLASLIFVYSIYLFNTESFQYKLDTGVFKFERKNHINIKYLHRVWYFLLICTVLFLSKRNTDSVHIRQMLFFGGIFYLLIGIVDIGSLERLFGVFLIYEMYFLSHVNFKNRKIVLLLYLMTICPIRIIQFLNSQYIDLYFPYELFFESEFKETY